MSLMVRSRQTTNPRQTAARTKILRARICPPWLQGTPVWGFGSLVTARHPNSTPQSEQRNIVLDHCPRSLHHLGRPPRFRLNPHPSLFAVPANDKTVPRGERAGGGFRWVA